jgi:hypothetical protein
MIRSLFRFALAPLAAAALGAMMLVAGPAQAVNVTISDPGNLCSWSFSPSTSTLTCGSTSVPTSLTCNPTATPSPQLVNANVTVAANCSGNSGTVTYVWTQTGADPACPPAGTGQSFPVAAGSPTPQGCAYALQASDSVKTVNPAPATATWVGMLCTFNSVPAAATVNTPIPLTVTCQGGGGAPTAIAWSTLPAGGAFGTGALTATGGTNSVTFTSASVWTIKADVTGPTASASATAVVSVSQAGVNCASQGFAKTIYYKWDFSVPGQPVPQSLDTLYLPDITGSKGGLGTNGILVVEFTPTAPANPGTGSIPYPYMSQISVTPYPAGSSSLTPWVAISTTPCDFTAPFPGSLPGSSSGSFTMKYGIGPVLLSGISQKPTAVSLTPGTTYYINIAGRSGVSAAAPYGVQNCSAGMVCDVRLSLFKPSDH